MKTINLLPKIDDSQQSTKLSLTFVQLGLIGLGALLLFASVWLQTEKSRLAGLMAEKQVEQSTLKNELERARLLQLELAYIQDRKQVWQEIAASHPPYSLIIGHVTAATLNDMRLTSFKAESTDALTVSGVAADRTVVSNFVNQLNESGQFINPTITQANNQNEGVLFSVTSRYATADKEKTGTKP